jgi:hypothetical protein
MPPAHVHVAHWSTDSIDGPNVCGSAPTVWAVSTRRIEVDLSDLDRDGVRLSRSVLEDVAHLLNSPFRMASQKFPEPSPSTSFYRPQRRIAVVTKPQAERVRVAINRLFNPPRLRGPAASIAPSGFAHAFQV